METTEVLVVGAGPVGLSLACDLLQRGVRCRIIDELVEPVVWSKAAVVHAGSMEALGALGVAEKIAAESRIVKGVSNNRDDREVFYIPFDGLHSTYPHVYGISQHETEAILAERVVALGGRVERGARLMEFREEGDSVVGEILCGGEREMVTAKYIAGCDGAHSTVRKRLGLEFEGGAYEERLIQADVRVDWPGRKREDAITMFFGERGQLGLFPLFRDGRYRVIVLVEDEPEPHPPLETFQKIATERGPLGITLSDPAWTVSFRIHHRHVDRMRKGRAFLVGDAAHIHSPVGGQGMNTGIQDACNLGWKLAVVIRGRGRPEILDSYDAERLPVAKSLVENTHRATQALTRVARIRNPLALAARDRALSLVTGLDVFRRRLQRSLSMLDIAYVDSPITHENSSGVARRLAFGSGPRPGKRAPVSLTADELRHRLFLFLTTADPDRAARAATLRARIDDRYGDVIMCSVVGPEDELHRVWGTRGDSVYLVRPDGYVGYRATPIYEEELLRYLDKIFVPRS